MSGNLWNRPAGSGDLRISRVLSKGYNDIYDYFSELNYSPEPQKEEFKT